MTQPNRTTRVRARFGLPLHSEAASDYHATLISKARQTASQINTTLELGQTALIVGPSGAGKSLILAQLATLCTRVIYPRTISTHTRRAVVDLFQLPLEEAVRILSICGLADAHQLVTPAGVLSEGQRARLSLALALEAAIRCDKPCTIIADEFGSTLDRTTAASLSVCIRKQIIPPIRLVAATAHDDLIEPLAPDVLLYTPLMSRPEILIRNETCTHIPGRSHQTGLSPALNNRASRIPGRSASGKELDTTTQLSLGFTTGQATRQHSPESSAPSTNQPKNSPA